MSMDCNDLSDEMSSDFQEVSKNVTLSNTGYMERSKNVLSENSFEVKPTSNKPLISVARRNERERKRVRLVNQGFAILRDRVPRDRCNRGRRSSKVETLRAAIIYIRHLQQLLLDNQIRYQQDMASYYANAANDSYLNTNTSFCCDNSFNIEYSQASVSAVSSPHQRRNSSVQFSNQVYDHQLAVSWLT